MDRKTISTILKTAVCAAAVAVMILTASCAKLKEYFDGWKAEFERVGDEIAAQSGKATEAPENGSPVEITAVYYLKQTGSALENKLKAIRRNPDDQSGVKYRVIAVILSDITAEDAKEAAKSAGADYPVVFPADVADCYIPDGLTDSVEPGGWAVVFFDDSGKQIAKLPLI